MGYSIAYNSGTTTPFGTFKQGPITMGLKPDEYTVSSGFTWYANAEYLNDAYLIISDTYSQGWSTQSESKPTIWRSATGTTESFVSLVNQLPDVNGVTGFTDSGSAMGYLQSTGKYFVSKDEYLGIVTDGLVLNLDAGWYPSYSGSGTTWKDIKGTNNGTLTNGPTFNSGDGGGIVFDGVNDFVNCPNNTNITGSSPSTIEVICKFSSVPNNFVNPIIQIGDGSGLGNFRLLYLRFVSGEYPQPRIAVAWYTAGFAYDFTPTVNEINFFTYTDDGSNEAKIYINGTLVITHTGYGALQTNTNQLLLGKFTYTSPNFSGTIYNSKIYNRVLSDSEILQNYNAQKGRFGL